MFFCWEARADSTSTPGSLNSEISLETSVNLDTSTSKNGLIFAIRHSLKSVSGCCAATSLMPHHADCANLRQLILCNATRRAVTPLLQIHAAAAAGQGRAGFGKTAPPAAGAHPAPPWYVKDRRCRRSARF